MSSLGHGGSSTGLPPQGNLKSLSSLGHNKGNGTARREDEVESDITEEVEHDLASEDEACADEQSQAPKDRLLCPSTMVPTCAGFSLTITPQ